MAQEREYLGVELLGDWMRIVTGAYDPASGTWRVIWPMVTGLPAISRTRRNPARSWA